MTEVTQQQKPAQESTPSPDQSREQAPLPELPPASETTLELEELQKQLDQTKDLLLRKAAEFENFKRRTENDMSALMRRASEDIIRNILPVVDDFERSLKASKGGSDAETLLKGVEMIYQKFVKTLESLGVTPLETVGKEFNVDFHDALLQVPRTDIPPQIIVEEVEKGYRYNDRVIRHAKVIVSTTPPAEAPQAN